MSIRKNTEGRFGAIWRAVQQAADEAKGYPDWKRGHSVDPNAEREPCSEKNELQVNQPSEELRS